MPDFEKKVLSIVSRIPFGRTLTYIEVARLAGRPKAARAVGRVLGKNPFPIIIPCHRVVAKNGLGGFNLGRDVKKKLLEMEKSCLKKAK